MSTIIRVKFRRDGHHDGGRFVPAYSEDLDLDELTPRARVLAEALHQSMQPGHDLPHRPLEVLFETEATNGELAQRPPVRPAAYGPVKDADQKALRVIDCGPFPKSTDPVALPMWLEHKARTFPLDWYPVGVRRQPRIPSWEEGAADRYLMKHGMLDFLREHGAGLGATAWDTLRGTGVLAPDRYVHKEPQWKPETVQAFVDRPRELWPLTRVAAFLGLTAGSARVQMRRWGFTAEGRGPGRGGENLYAADLVQAAHTHRPGRGRRRTDLIDETGT